MRIREKFAIAQIFIGNYLLTTNQLNVLKQLKENKVSEEEWRKENPLNLIIGECEEVLRLVNEVKCATRHLLVEYLTRPVN